MIDTAEKRAREILKTFAGEKPPILRQFDIGGGIPAALIYIEELVDGEAMTRDIVRPLMYSDVKDSARLMDDIMRRVIPFTGVVRWSDLSMAASLMLDGDAVLLIDGQEDFLCVAVKKWAHRSVEEPPTSSVIRGPREGFNEDLRTNISLLRRRLKTPDLVFDVIKVGKYSSTSVAVAYIKTVADEGIVSQIKDKISRINIDGILDSAYISAFLESNRRTVFSQVGNTEKPDIAAGKMLEGRICVIVDGSPAVLTLPYVFVESFQDSGDYYGLTERRNILRVLRVASFVMAIFLPGLYVAMLLFHYDMLPTDFLLTIINARSGIPMNPMLELIVTMLLFEILQEASVRMPRYIGSALSIVGALILGETAVKAGTISSPAVMISAVSAITIYNVPEQADIVNMMRFVFTLLGGFMGFFGLIAGAVLLALHMLSLNSFGVSYMAPYAPLYDNDKQDALLMKPVTQRFMRPESIPTKNRIRMRHSK